jgi:hypothetical protein
MSRENQKDYDGRENQKDHDKGQGKSERSRSRNTKASEYWMTSN